MKTEQEKEMIRQIAWAAWKSAANAYRMYPDNKHTFTDYWHDLGKSEMDKALSAATPSPEAPINAVVREDGEWIKALNLKTPDELDSNICVGDTIKIYGEQTKVLGFYGAFNEALMKWETIILTEGRGDPFERSLNKIEVLTPTEGPFTKSKRNGTYPSKPEIKEDKQEQGEVIKNIGSIKRNAEKINQHTWKVYKEQILEHVEDLEAILSTPPANPSGVRSKEDVLETWMKKDGVFREKVLGAMEEYHSQFKSNPDAVEFTEWLDMKGYRIHGWDRGQRDAIYQLFKAQPGK